MSPKKRNILRRTILAGRDTLPEGEQSDRSSTICGKLFNLREVQNARTIFIYMHFRSEVLTAEFISLCLASGKTVTIPYTIPDEKRLISVQIHDLQRDVAPGYCGIPEPVPRLLQTARYNPDKIDVAIIPGSVFDRAGGRLGYGGGYYDRFLTREASRAFRIGLAYEIQLVGRVPVQQHDQLMDFVVTEDNIYDCRRNRHAQDSRLSS
jgi:5-formyltetrahydrofolate cyclo-ligase